MKKLILIILVSYLLPHASVAQPGDRWYTLTIGGKPAGYYHEVVAVTDSGVTSEIEMNIRISRLGSETVMESRQVSTEDRQGNLKTSDIDLLYSKQLNTSKAIVLPGLIRVTNQAGGKQSTTDIPYSGTLTGNDRIRVLTIENLKAPGDSIAYLLYFPDLGTVAVGRRTFIGYETLNLNGMSIKALRVKDRYEGVPVVRDLWLDNNGRLLKTSEPSPFGQTMMVLSDKTTAVALATMKVELSEDQYSASIALANVRLPQPRQMESVTVKITQNNPDAGMPDFSGTYQEVLEKKNNYVILKINRPAIGADKEPLTPVEKSEYLESGFFIDKDDTVAQRLASQISGGERDPWKKVVLLRDWVNTHMNFNAGIVLAPSSEAIRNLEGTCISYATVLTTLCRAAGIPARYLMGFVYVDGMWGGHAWVEAYINDSWIPVDAAMPSPGGIADAARFYFARNSVRNGMGEFLVAGARLYSNVTIETINYTTNGRMVQATPSPYVVDEFRYVNPGTGITMKALEGFVFRDVDSVYPESVLFAMENQEAGERIEFHVKYTEPRTSAENEVQKRTSGDTPIKRITFRGIDALKSEMPGRVVLAIPNGSDIYIFVSSGRDASENLKRALKGFAFQKF